MLSEVVEVAELIGTEDACRNAEDGELSIDAQLNIIYVLEIA